MVYRLRQAAPNKFVHSDNAKVGVIIVIWLRKVTESPLGSNWMGFSLTHLVSSPEGQYLINGVAYHKTLSCVIYDFNGAYLYNFNINHI